MPVPFCVEAFGAGATIAVEIAWGADILADPTTWAWTDITDDVRVANGVHTKHGRSDEASRTQPASCTMTLDNSTGAYSLGGRSPNWPNVKQNTPVRVVVNLNDGLGDAMIFLGYADSWTPSWSREGSVADVELVASGVLRRLEQNNAPIMSSLRRRLSSESNVVAYWPLEEGKNATQALSAIPGAAALIWQGPAPKFADDSETFPATISTTRMTATLVTGFVQPYANTGAWQVRSLLQVPESGTGMANGSNLMTVILRGGTIAEVRVEYTTGGGMAVKVYDTSYTLVHNGTYSMAVNGLEGRIFIEMEQNGANIDWTVGHQSTTNPTASIIGNFSLIGQTLGTVNRVLIGSVSHNPGPAYGHVVVQNEVTGIFDDFDELSAFDGELAYLRLYRLCDENGIRRYAVGDGTSLDQPTDIMGPQRPLPLLSLLRECETVDQGILFDGYGSLSQGIDASSGGLVLWLRRAIEGESSTVMALRASELSQPLKPVADDQGRVNRATASRAQGTTASYEDVDGPLGTASIGFYDGSIEVNIQDDTAVQYYASWLVNKGTVEGYRFPTLQVNLTATPHHADNWLNLAPGEQLDLVIDDPVLAQLVDETVPLVVQGYEQVLTPHKWTGVLSCAPADPWLVGEIAADSGDTNVDIMRPDATGSTLAAGAAVGATSLSVTEGTELWTTDSDDFPFKVEIAGVPVHVTNITGASSPQTFTVTAVTKALPIGSTVQLYRPRVLGL